VKVIASGTIGRSGLGGQAWATLQYLLGLRALGHEVCYLEDCGETSYVWDWEREQWDYELDYPSAYVQSCLAPFGLEDCWIYRTNADARGMPIERFIEFCRGADLLLLRAVPLWVWREEYGWPARRAFIDVDPGFTQISIAQNDRGIAAGVAHCERRFTVAQGLGTPECAIPTAGGPWLTTVPPVHLPEWPVAVEPAEPFTSVIRWQGFREADFQGTSYGQRDKAFPRFLSLPRRTTQTFRLALMGTDPQALQAAGWETVPGEVASRTPAAYRDFIRSSRAEFCVPKHGYVASRSGWISDRSVCYLASGRPVLMEDTGLPDGLRGGRGLLTFVDPDSALAGVTAINEDYPAQCRAARELAEHVFSAEKVLPALLGAAMN
jgi:hypothetical protein